MSHFFYPISLCKTNAVHKLCALNKSSRDCADIIQCKESNCRKCDGKLSFIPTRNITMWLEQIRLSDIQTRVYSRACFIRMIVVPKNKLYATIYLLLQSDKCKRCFISLHQLAIWFKMKEASSL